MTELSEIGPLARPRRGVSIVALLIWVLIAGAGGAVAWEIYGGELRSRLGIVPEEPPRTATSDPAAATPASGELVTLVKELQSSQKRTADQLETVVQLLTSEQASSRTMADALAALSAKVDALQRPVPAPPPVVRRPAPPVASVASPPPRRPPLAAAPRTLVPSAEPDQAEPDSPPGAAAGNRP